MSSRHQILVSSPTANSAAPMIHVLQAADVGNIKRWNRRLSAFVASGVIHTILITGFILICRAMADATPPEKQKVITNTRMEIVEDKQETNYDVRIDHDLDSSLAAQLEPFEMNDFSVEAPVVEAEPVGLPDHQEAFTPRTSSVGSFTTEIAEPGATIKDDFGFLAPGKMGVGGDVGILGMEGNSGLPAEIKNRLAQAGGKTGQIQITLVWNNRNDLDLHCIDPNGEEIFYGNSRAQRGSNGHLDVDKNVNGETMKPIENIYFPQGKAPPGRYRVLLTHFSLQGSPDPTYYKVYVKVNDKSFSFNGSIWSGSPKRLVYEFTLAKQPTASTGGLRAP